MPARPLPEGTLTFLFTDLEGSTALLERLGRDRYRGVLDDYRGLLRRAIEAAGGIEVDSQGDAVFAVFPSAAGALAAAVAAQRSLAAHEWPDGAAVRARAGLHTGEAAVTDECYVGIAVHRGRRVCEAAHGGQVLVSAATRAIVGSEPPAGVRLRDLGDVRLSGLDEVERLFQAVADGLPDTFPAPRAARPPAAERPPLLERAGELASVTAAVDAAAPAPAASSSCRGRPGSARRRCSPRRGHGRRRPASRCCRRAAASSSRRSRTASCVSSSSPCWRTRIRTSGPGCSTAPPRTPRGSSRRGSTQRAGRRARTRPSHCCTGSTG